MGLKDEIKGRAKEAAGALSDDDRLQREGKADRTAGKLKDGIDKTKDKLNAALDRASSARGKKKW